MIIKDTTTGETVYDSEKSNGKSFSINDYTIEATGLDGWMSYRYQYKAGVHDFFGYAETEEEALETIRKAGL